MKNKSVKKLIGKGEVKAAIQALKEDAQNHPNLLQQITALEAEHSILTRDKKLAIQDPDDVITRENRITFALLQITNDLFQGNGSIRPNTKNAFRLAFRYVINDIFKSPLDNIITWILATLMLLFSLVILYSFFFQESYLIPYPYKYFLPLPFLFFLIVIFYNKILIILERTRKQRVFKTIESSPIKSFGYFDFEDAEIFKKLQREEDIEICLEGIQEDNFRFGVLSGESGCGKTSFVRAGLCPALKEKNFTCVVVKFTNEAPLDSIKKALQQQLPDAENLDDKEHLFDLLKDNLGNTANNGLVLILDQFEQFFTHYKTAKARLNFIEQLNQCYKNLAEVKILVSLRGDFTDRLFEIQNVLGYYLRTRHNYFQLNKFTPQQAVAIFQVMANAEDIDYDEDFLMKMCSDELASEEDGLISAVDIQIISFIIKGQKQQERAFTEKAFQSMGGIEGLLQRYLREELETPNYYNTDQATLKVLLAFIDLENNVRGGELSLKQLKQKLADRRIFMILPAILEWLEELRLITKLINAKNEFVYELAHERLIFPLASVAGHTLGEIDKANQILNKRTNEWLANDKDDHFLPSLKEYRLILRQKRINRIKWGNKKKWKERLLERKSMKVRTQRLGVGFFSLILCIILVYIGNKQTNQFKYCKVVPDTLKKLVIGVKTVNKKLIIDSLTKYEPLEFSLSIINSLSDQNVKDEAYSEVVLNWTDSIKIDGENVTLIKIFKVIDSINNEEQKCYALRNIAIAAARFRDTLVLKDAFEKVMSMEDENYKSFAFQGIVEAVACIRDTVIIEQAFKALDSLKSKNHKSCVLQGIAKAAAQMGDKLLLKRVFDLAKRIDNDTLLSPVLSEIAKSAAQIGNKEMLEKTIELVNGMVAELPKSNVFIDIAKAKAHLVDIAGAHRYLKKSLDQVLCIRDTSMIPSALKYILETSIQIKDTTILEKVLCAAISLEDEKYKAITLGDIAATSVQIGNISILNQVNEAADTLQEEKHRFSTLREVAIAAVQIGDIEKLKDVAEIAADISSDPKLRSSALGEIASASVYIRNRAILKQTLEAAEFIEIEEYRSHVLSEIAKASAQMEDKDLFNEALKELNSLEKETYKSNALRNIAEAMIHIKEKTILNQTLNAVADMEISDAKYNALKAIVKAAAFTTDEVLLKKTLELSASLSNEEYKSNLIRFITQAATQINYFNLLEDIEDQLSKILVLENKNIVQEALVSAYLKHSKYSIAYQKAQSMPLAVAKWKALAFFNLRKAWNEKDNFRPIIID